MGLNKRNSPSLSANHFNSLMTLPQKVMCALFGKYTLASVMREPSHVPFRKMNLLSGSTKDCLNTNGACLLIKMETPFVLAEEFVAW